MFSSLVWISVNQTVGTQIAIWHPAFFEKRTLSTAHLLSRTITLCMYNNFEPSLDKACRPCLAQSPIFVSCHVTSSSYSQILPAAPITMPTSKTLKCTLHTSTIALYLGSQFPHVILLAASLSVPLSL